MTKKPKIYDKSRINPILAPKLAGKKIKMSMIRPAYAENNNF